MPKNAHDRVLDAVDFGTVPKTISPISRQDQREDFGNSHWGVRLSDNKDRPYEKSKHVFIKKAIWYFCLFFCT